MHDSNNVVDVNARHCCLSSAKGDAMRCKWSRHTGKTCSTSIAYDGQICTYLPCVRIAEDGGYFNRTSLFNVCIVYFFSFATFVCSAFNDADDVHGNLAE